MRARIVQRPKTATQSGVARAGDWVLDYQPTVREVNDPLMGWWGGGDTQEQVRLAFGTQAEAVAYALQAPRDAVISELTIKPSPR